MIIHLPWPISVNEIYKAALKGPRRIYKTTPAKDYQRKVVEECMTQGVSGKHLEGDLVVEVICQEPDHRIRDTSNLPKLVYDGMTDAGVWLDDSQVRDERWIRVRAKRGEPGRLTVAIERQTEGDTHGRDPRDDDEDAG